MKRALVQLADYWLSSRIRPEKLMHRVIEGRKQSPAGPRVLCLFSHFDPEDQVDPYVIYYLQSLKDLGVEILFISTCRSLRETDLDQLKALCFRIILRENLTLDFGSWKTGLFQLESHGPHLQEFDQLIFANDSVYGPLFPLKDVFHQLKDYEVAGITSSQEMKYHLQSYFLIFQKQVFLSPAFAKFWRNFRFYRSKRTIIENYEIGLSQLALKMKWKMGALVEIPNVLNPTLSAWDQLIEVHHAPFLKTEVLKLNRMNSPRIHDWRAIVGMPKITQMIEQHLKRVQAGASSLRPPLGESPGPSP